MSLLPVGYGLHAAIDDRQYNIAQDLIKPQLTLKQRYSCPWGG